MNKERLIIWGASGHARVVADIARLTGRYEIAGFIDDTQPERRGEAFSGAPILGTREVLLDLLHAGLRTIFIAVGDPQARLELGGIAQNSGFELCTLVHPAAIVASDVRMKDGTLVVAGAILNPGCRLGAHVVVNTGATVDHECTLADGAMICPGVHLAGNVSVGRAAWVGIGAIVKERTHIGEGAVVGAGAVVVRDVPAHSVVYGVPARVHERISSDA